MRYDEYIFHNNCIRFCDPANERYYSGHPDSGLREEYRRLSCAKITLFAESCAAAVVAFTDPWHLAGSFLLTSSADDKTKEKAEENKRKKNKTKTDKRKKQGKNQPKRKKQKPTKEKARQKSQKQYIFTKDKRSRRAARSTKEKKNKNE